MGEARVWEEIGFESIFLLYRRSFGEKMDDTGDLSFCKRRRN